MCRDPLQKDEGRGDVFLRGVSVEMEGGVLLRPPGRSPFGPFRVCLCLVAPAPIRPRNLPRHFAHYFLSYF